VILLALGSAVYCILVVVALRNFLAQEQKRNTEPVTFVKPLRGVDAGLEDNLRSVFGQRGQFQVVLAVEERNDPAYAVAEKLMAEYPQVDAQLIVTGAPQWANPKVWKLAQAWILARYELIVISDSDIWLPSRFVEQVDPQFDVATYPYRAVGGPSVWSSLEAIGMNTEFLAGMLVARLVEGGVKFAVGPTMHVRKGVIDKIGGWEKLSEYLAEDFVIGQRAAEQGMKVGIARAVVEHRIGSQDRATNFAHRLRWMRSTRASRGWAYLGQFFAMPTAVALIVAPFAPVASAAVMALWLAAAISVARVVEAKMTVALLAQDILSFCFWLAGWFGRDIVWRGRKYTLQPDGRFVRA
jgi:ceramide glucosyltransferase